MHPEKALSAPTIHLDVRMEHAFMMGYLFATQIPHAYHSVGGVTEKKIVRMEVTSQNAKMLLAAPPGRNLQSIAALGVVIGKL